MTPKEKARLLYELIRYDVSTLKGTEALIDEVSKRCALIAVDEIQQAVMHLDDDSEDFWFEVKQEIEKL